MRLERSARTIRSAILVLLLAMLMMSASASQAQAASIVGSKHDLSYLAAGHTLSFWPVFDDYNEVCIYCHTPHNARAAVPLWNRPATTTVFSIYSSETLDSTPGQPGHASKLCLSCHDGSLAVDQIVNMPNGDWPAWDPYGVHGKMIYPYQTAHADCGFCHQPQLAQSFGDFTPTFFGSNLSNDHPVGIAYTAAADLVPLPPTGKFTNGVKTVGGKVECTSCHNPHDPARKSFLVASNAGSALCKTCHVK